MTAAIGSSTASPPIVQTAIQKLSDIGSLSVDDAMFYLSMLTLHNKDQRIKDKLTEMKSMQESIQSARSLIGELNNRRDQKNAFSLTAEQTATFKRLMESAGFSISLPSGVSLSGSGNNEVLQFAAQSDNGRMNELIKNVADQLDSVIKSNNTSVEMANLDLQREMTQRTQILEISTQVQKKADDARSAIIRNI